MYLLSVKTVLDFDVFIVCKTALDFDVFIVCKTALDFDDCIRFWCIYCL